MIKKKNPFEKKNEELLKKLKTQIQKEEFVGMSGPGLCIGDTIFSVDEKNQQIAIDAIWEVVDEIKSRQDHTDFPKCGIKPLIKAITSLSHKRLVEGSFEQDYDLDFPHTDRSIFNDTRTRNYKLNQTAVQALDKINNLIFD